MKEVSCGEGLFGVMAWRLVGTGAMGGGGTRGKCLVGTAHPTGFLVVDAGGGILVFC